MILKYASFLFVFEKILFKISLIKLKRRLYIIDNYLKYRN